MGRSTKVGNVYVKGQPACPINCQYCSVTEVDYRRDSINENIPWITVNKAVTALNVPMIYADIDDPSCYWGDPDYFRGDILSFQALSDPFWPVHKRSLNVFLQKYQETARLLTAVTKWPLSNVQLDGLTGIENFVLVVSMTGAESIEEISTKRQLELIESALSRQIPVIPLIHPYIRGVSDLGFLPSLKALGINEVVVKGLRPEKSMKWLGEHYDYYMQYIGQEHLASDALEQLAQAAIAETTLPVIYAKHSRPMEFSEFQLEQGMQHLIQNAMITSSASESEVWQSVKDRRRSVGSV